MGRPSLGKGARKITGSTKVTGVEAELLIAQHGTLHAGMRAALDYYLAKDQLRRDLIEADVDPADMEQVVGERIELPATVIPCRIHKGYVETRRWMERGQEQVERTCADCGHVTTGPAR